MTERPENRRRFPRIPAEHVVLFRPIGPGAQERLAKTRVVGLGGCMFIADRDLEKNSLIELQISVEGQVISTDARVAYAINKGHAVYEIGVEFLRLRPRDADAIGKLLEVDEG